ncbi:MAG: ribosome recycling factor [Patescibacteria group bacterium]|nr:ribosome recycling factor [Patescibacteria group bacterium]MDD4611067.1 ribosome recycling factor [Patescibacteria group bacterium]
MNKYLQAKSGEFQKTIDFFKKEISTLRTGRANPVMFEGIMVDVYGSKTPLNGVANIAVSDARSMTITPWDKNNLKEIERSITEANLGMGIINEGIRIRITIPQMTEENRKELVKKLNEKMEKARVAMRQIRDEVKVAIEAAEEEKEFGEDDKFRFLKELDDEIKKVNEELEEIRKKKEEEIMTI